MRIKIGVNMVNISQLDLKLQGLLHVVIIKAGQQGIRVTAIQGWRDIATQLHLFEQGLSAAKGFDGPHTRIVNGLPCSAAFDFACFDDNGNYIKDGSHPNYTKVGAIAKEEGLVWGGDWRKPDPDHCELPNWSTVNI